MVRISEFLLYPSFYSLVITGIILIFIAVLFVKNFKKLLKLDSYKFISLLCVMAVSIGNHGLLHALFEIGSKPKPNLDLTTLF